jgi:pilus assembly protein Flp/PilA
MSTRYAGPAGSGMTGDPGDGVGTGDAQGFRLCALEARERLRALFERQRGQGMVEYGLILVLIAIVVVLILQVVGHQVSNVFSNLSSGLAT